ncbi:hypothetical protein CspeluHIS016_0100170 [Cutaneotrichosporon spelunceum]|uniref:Uncharacterized protein n=1 Tax=Cutaneotrichosporon spelunceum TaxID=1672016 RepID=A0AAD3TN94_9TREE|nr:hypothetical protein CspeluHIS016_0100170 [Cutaneotrichosporon spelunceum]
MSSTTEPLSIGDQNYEVLAADDAGVQVLLDQMHQSIAKVENPRFLQSVLSKYHIQNGEPQVPMALVKPGCDGCSNSKKPKACYAGLREGGFLRCLPCGRRMCSFEPRSKSSSGAWMVAQNDIPLVADYVAGTSSLIRHLIKDLPPSHPLVSAARTHIGQGKTILDRVNEGRIGPRHKPTAAPDTAALRPHEAIASDVAAIDELADRVHARAAEAGEPAKSPDEGDAQYPQMDNYAPPPFDLPPIGEDETGVEAMLPRDEEAEEERKRKLQTTSGRGAAKRSRGRGRGRA